MQFDVSALQNVTKQLKSRTNESSSLRSKVQTPMQMKKNNEIEELLYMGKYGKTYGNINNQKKDQLVQQFLVRRKRSLELMYTNGLYHSVEQINNTRVDAPQIISDITLSQNNQKLIVFFSIVGNNAQVQIKTFHWDSSAQTFLEYDDKNIGNIKNMKNLILKNNEPFEIKIELSVSSKARNDPRMYIEVNQMANFIHIKLPKFIFGREVLDPMNQLERVMLSYDRRLLICDRVVIQMSEKEDDVQDIGCFHRTQESSLVAYKFYSLLDKIERKFVQYRMREDPSQFVEFSYDQEPLTSSEQPNTVYALNLLD